MRWLALSMITACAAVTPPATHPAVPANGAVQGASRAAIVPSNRVVDGVVSLYIVPIDAEHVALVDCGMDPKGAAILGALAERHLRADNVVAIFVTHRHGDHVGGCDLFPKARIYAAPGATAEEGEGTTAIRDGETVNVDGVRVTAYAVPGHTADSVAYLASGVLYLGDAAMAGADGTSVNGSARRFHGESADPDPEHLNAEPLRRLYARLTADHADVRELAFGHSSPMTGLAPLATVH